MPLALLVFLQVGKPSDMYIDDDRAAYLTEAFPAMIEVRDQHYGRDQQTSCGSIQRLMKL